MTNIKLNVANQQGRLIRKIFGIGRNINMRRIEKTLCNTNRKSSTNSIETMIRRNAFCAPDSCSMHTFIDNHQLSDSAYIDDDDAKKKIKINCVPSNLHIVIRPDGHLSTTHCGNNTFQLLVAPFNVEYEAATSKLEKSILRSRILDIVYSRGFKFIMQISRKKDTFYEVDERVAWEKIGEALWIERQKMERKSNINHFK